MDEFHKSSIRSLVANLVDWLPTLEENLSVRMSSEGIMLALITELNSELTDLARMDLGFKEVLTFLKGSEYVKGLPVIEDMVVIEESVIPPTAFRMLLEEQVRFKGEVWIVHKNDSDPFPSNPHAHNYESGLKMHLGTGELFLGTQLIGKLRKKQFVIFRKRFKKSKLPELAI